MDESFADRLRCKAKTAFESGEYAQAIESFDALFAITNDPNDQRWLGCTLFMLGRYTEANDTFELVLQGDTNDPVALNWLARIKATCAESSLRDGRMAVELATRLCEISRWEDWAHVSVLAAAYAECGDWEQAEHFATVALELAPDDEKHRRHTRVNEYRRQLPFRSSPDTDQSLLVDGNDKCQRRSSRSGWVW